ncbi:cell adhesion molecule DSCAML1-like isoform X2 [Tachysurus vachellii]|uniref:cell adhesion molecule DSCAML1-like isoform X2 n=1 Tax=Tachysurus vachellii TaxID=175792 RepID=UPI00296AF284|nr:cell adhesion molecule DSCAML1-like isoform X2 [Tachysurus vachellii]
MMRHTAAVGQCVFSSNSLFGLMCWSSGRMQVCFLLLLLIQLHVTEGCSLEGNGETERITAYTGDSVLLPCSCTELHRKPETFTWEKSTGLFNWTQISPESDEYKERFQLVNDHSSGNLSLLISHLTEQDGGFYMCRVKVGEYRFISLTVKGCSLKGNGETEEITAYTGDSVLLPCSCTELHRKPETFTWEKYTNNWTQISPESDEYKERFQLVNDHSSGNLSLLISHLTEQDGGLYMCDVKVGEYRFISLTVKGCSLKGNGETEEITAYTGDSVLLPCSCTELHRKPETFTWKKSTNNWTQISPESDEYKERFQLVNDHSSGNLSLLISHLTEQDGGVYRCDVKGGEYRDISLTVKGCRLNQQTVNVTGIVGQSVLLPCSCSELQAKPHTFRWSFNKGSDDIKIFPKEQTNLYTDRVQVFNDHPPGNLSLLISHLTVEDGGWYKCEIEEMTTDIYLTLEVTRETPSKSTPKNKPDVINTTPTLMDNEKRFETDEDSNQSPPYNRVVIISSSVAAVLLLLLILGGVMYWKYRGQRRGQTKISDGQTGQRTHQKKQDINEPLNLTVTSDPTYEAVHKQNDSDVLYAAINPETKHKKAEDKNDSEVLYAVINPESKLKKAVAKDDVTYSSVACNNTVRAANSPVTSEDTTLYASIKTN